MTSLLFIQSCPPHGSVNAQEGLDALLMGTAFAECSVLFTGTGVLQLLNEQETSALGVKAFSASFAVLKEYGVKHVYCCHLSMETFGLSANDLVIDVEPISEAEMRRVIMGHGRILNF